MFGIKPEGTGGNKVLEKDFDQGAGSVGPPPGSATLVNLSKEFVYFTHAIFFTHGFLDKDPIQEFINESRDSPVISVMSFEKPVFEGMKYKGNTEWNYKLWPPNKKSWSALLRFLATVGMLDRTRNTFVKALPHAIEVVDPLVMAKKECLPVPLPMVSVTVFGLSGMRRKVYVRNATNPPFNLPFVHIGPPDPNVVKLGERILQDDQKPYRSVDPFYGGVSHE